MTSIADYVVQRTANAANYLEFTLANTGETCIRELSAVLAYHSQTATANLGKASLFDGATESVIFNGDMSETTIQYASVISAPAGAPWTQAAVNGLLTRVGFSTDVSPDPYWDAIVVEVAAA